MTLVDNPSSSTFTNAELVRLGTYRAAVAAGFYTDWDGSTGEADTELLAWLREPRAEGAVHEYPFTPDERERLERCRQGVAAGYYSDNMPPETERPE